MGREEEVMRYGGFQHPSSLGKVRAFRKALLSSQLLWFDVVVVVVAAVSFACHAWLDVVEQRDRWGVVSQSSQVFL